MNTFQPLIFTPFAFQTAHAAIQTLLFAEVFANAGDNLPVVAPDRGPYEHVP